MFLGIKSRYHTPRMHVETRDDVIDHDWSRHVTKNKYQSTQYVTVCSLSGSYWRDSEGGARQLRRVWSLQGSASVSYDGTGLLQFDIDGATTCHRIVYFSGESARRRKRKIHPADAIVGTGRVGRGPGTGGGVLLVLGTLSCLVEDTTCQRDGNVIVVASFLVARGSILTPWERWTPDFGNVVARANNTPLPLRHQNREHNLASWQKISHRGQFRLRWCSTKLVREGGGRCFGSQVSSVRKI